MKQTITSAESVNTGIAQVSYRGEVPPSAYRGEAPESGCRGGISVSANLDIDEVPTANRLPKLLIKVISKETGKPIQNCKIIFRGYGYRTSNKDSEQRTNSDGKVNYCYPPEIHFLYVIVNDVVVINQDTPEKLSGEYIVRI